MLIYTITLIYELLHEKQDAFYKECATTLLPRIWLITPMSSFVRLNTWDRGIRHETSDFLEEGVDRSAEDVVLDVHLSIAIRAIR
jgi:hypothetical protein